MTASRGRQRAGRQMTAKFDVQAQKAMRRLRNAAMDFGGLPPIECAVEQ